MIDPDARTDDDDDDAPACSIKSLAKRHLVTAAGVAYSINPINAPMSQMRGAGSTVDVMDPLSIAILTTKYWGPSPRTLSVSFMELTPADLRARIVSHLNAWSKTGCISFAEADADRVGEVRISREAPGYWSYLGTDILLIPATRPTMNLQGFTMATPEREYKRVVRHEAGHTLGFPHEHMRKELVARIDPQKAYAYFWSDQGWSQEMVDRQVLTPLDTVTLYGTPADQTSIMCYQLPGTITKNGKPIRGGTDINKTDARFAGTIYPKAMPTVPVSLAPAVASAGDDWPEAEDVDMSFAMGGGLGSNIA